MEERFYRVVAETLTGRTGDFQPTALLKQDLKVNSLDFLVLILALEAEYRCHLSDGALSLVVTLGDLENLVQESTGKVVAEGDSEPGKLL